MYAFRISEVCFRETRDSRVVGSIPTLGMVRI